MNKPAPEIRTEEELPKENTPTCPALPSEKSAGATAARDDCCITCTP